MKILYVTLHHPNFGMGGSEQVLFDLACSVSKRPGMEVACAVNPGDLAERLRAARIPVFEIAWPKIKTLKTLSVLKCLIATFQPDLIHSFHRYLSFLLTLFLSRGNRLLYTEQVFRRDKKWLFCYGDQIVSCHDSVRENLIQYYRVAPERVVTIPNMIMPKTPDSEKLQILQKKYPKNPGQAFALCLARLEEQKGHRYLIDAVSRLPFSYKKRLKIFLLGDGSLAAELRNKVSQNQISECFIFCGYSRDTAEFLSLCDFIILPSLWEGMPLSILEAYSASKPVIATDIPGSRESIQNERTGLLVPAKNADALARGIMKFMDSPDKTLVMGRQAYASWEEAFPFEKMIDSYCQLYQKMWGKKRGRDESNKQDF